MPDKLSSGQVVQTFLRLCSEFEFDAAFELIGEDCVYRNMPFHTARGKQRIVRDLNGMFRLLNQFEVEMVNIAVNKNVVLTERVDTLGGRFFKIDLQLMGVFVVEDGKISEWRDYFDWSSFGGKFIAGGFARFLSRR